jgi:hypothetical protein
MERHDDQGWTESRDGFQMRWPQITYFKFRESRLFITHSAISWPDMVAIYSRH